MREDTLTPALQEVLALLATGLSNKEIAFHRKRSIRTINVQVGEILRATDCRNRVEATAYYWVNNKNE